MFKRHRQFVFALATIATGAALILPPRYLAKLSNVGAAVPVDPIYRCELEYSRSQLLISVETRRFQIAKTLQKGDPTAGIDPGTPGRPQVEGELELAQLESQRMDLQTNLKIAKAKWIRLAYLRSLKPSAGAGLEEARAEFLSTQASLRRNEEQIAKLNPAKLSFAKP